MSCSQQSIASGYRGMRGVTLLELLVTLAIVAILAAVALPSFREFSIRMGTTDNTNQVVRALNIARSEAVKRGRTVSVIANGGNWSSGWHVVVAKKTAVGVIEDIPASPGSTSAACAAHVEDGTVSLCLLFREALENNFTVLGTANRVDFGPTGALRGSDPFNFSVCRPSQHADATQSRRIHVTLSGTVESRRDTTGAPAGACG